ncbi:MAG: ABC transporter ATP-binding protein [Opitutaceae bacterium]|nr:ABC transporter ATP-binding protein [Opitutaceae bacterium]
MPPVISVTDLGKRYFLSHERKGDTLRDSLALGARGLWRRLSRRADPAAREEFWALRDVSFEVAQGDVIGIIGRNGAGKSTLLKVLSRITEPTAGRAVIRGRVASLLEVGTGFHPELSGRENIYLNGAILGMPREEIRRKFDEIVAFAEVERFLDTQVKHYSSGMYVRLAFAVAAHLEPEILIVDEVLAVGDAAFQKKCLGKMGEVARDSGRTVLFVSHNTAALQAICRTGLWLQQGRLVRQGPINDCLSAYLAAGAESAVFAPADPGRPHITAVTVDREALAAGRLRISVGFKSPFPLGRPVVGIILHNKFGQPLAGSNGRMLGERWAPPAAAAGVVTAEINPLPLHSDTYRASVYLGDAAQDYDEKREAVEFDFVSPRFYPQAPRVDVIGQVDLPWQWSLAPDGPRAS